MATPILIVGDVGTGKSASIRTLDPKETIIICGHNKGLPFKGWKNLYKTEGDFINRVVVEDAGIALECVRRINSNRPEIKNIVIDDSQYLMSNEANKRIDEKVWDMTRQVQAKFSNLIIYSGSPGIRKDLRVIFLNHSKLGEDGQQEMLTLGKILNEREKIEGRFQITLYSYFIADKNEYMFVTNRTATLPARSPMGMFDEKLIPNDLALVIKACNEYDNKDIPDLEKGKTAETFKKNVVMPAVREAKREAKREQREYTEG